MPPVPVLLDQWSVWSRDMAFHCWLILKNLTTEVHGDNVEAALDFVADSLEISNEMYTAAMALRSSGERVKIVAETVEFSQQYCPLGHGLHGYNLPYPKDNSPLKTAMLWVSLLASLAVTNLTDRILQHGCVILYHYATQVKHMPGAFICVALLCWLWILNY